MYSRRRLKRKYLRSFIARLWDNRAEMNFRPLNPIILTAEILNAKIADEMQRRNAGGA